MEIIFITGMMGVGKSTVGRLLAQQLNVAFVDLDKLIEQEAGEIISKVFEKHGEEKFRELESQALKKVCELKSGVIALGAGALERDENFEQVQKSGKLIYLKADLELLLGRNLKGSDRPMLKDAKTPTELRARLQELLTRREQRYSQAQITMEVTDKDTPLAVTLKLMQLVG